MTTPRWILPTVSGIAAVAMLIGGGLIGSTLAEHTTHHVASGTEFVPVIAPVSDGQGSAASDPAGPGTTAALSEVIANREVRVPATDPDALDPELLNLITTLSESADPVEELMVLDRDGDSDASGGEGASGGDDPCAPREGQSAEDCPEGLTSTVLPMLARPSFLFTARAFPPTQAEHLANPETGLVWCDGLTTSETSVPFGIVSSVPASFTLRYWPSAHPDQVTDAGVIETSARDTADFEESLATLSEPDRAPFLRHCLTLNDLEPNTTYTAVVSGIDFDYRVHAPMTVRFNSGGAPTHPGVRIIPVGENLLWVSALHPPDQRVDIRVVVRTPTTISDCGYLDAPSREALWPLTDTEVNASPDSQNFERAPETFTKKHIMTFAVPEGSTAQVCARWYEAGSDSTSWERVQPLFESAAVVQTPDRLVPKVLLNEVSSLTTTLESVDVSVSTERGRFCGSFTWTSTPSYPELPLWICDSTRNTGTASADSRGRFGDRGASNDLVLRITSSFRGTVDTERTAYIPAIDHGCRGVCLAPVDRSYRISLGTTERSAGLCGASFGTCTPPTEEVSAGTILVTVRWSQGSMNGRSDWNVTSTRDRAPEYVVPDEAQFDLTQRWRFSAPRYASHFATSGVGPYVTGQFRLDVDRPVDYTIRFTEGDSFSQALGCDNEGAPLVTGGHADGPTEVVMPGVCLGTLYFAEIEIVEADGRREVWSVNDPAHYWGAATIRNVPEIAAMLAVDLRASSLPYSVLSNYSFIVNGQGFASDETRSGLCLDTGELHYSEAREVRLGSTVEVSVTMRLRTAAAHSGDDCSDLGESDTKTVTAQVPLVDFYSHDGVTITAPDAYDLHLVLHATQPGGTVIGG